MKRRYVIICLFLLIACCIPFAGCGSGDPSVFVFLSVRMKGNGDGTITAVAQNEFELAHTAVPIELSVMFSEDYQSDISKMQTVKSERTDDLKPFGSFSVDVTAADGYFCAVVSYSVNGDVRYIQTETLQYDLNGNRVQSPENGS